MKTPIFDFVNNYSQNKIFRLHMPGHKGVPQLGIEHMDITEIDGADSLFEADGIIRESEENASALFSAHTLYSTEGSSLSIRAMIYLVTLYAKTMGRSAAILAGRNAHKAFLSAVSLLDVAVTWLYPEYGASYLSCKIDAAALEHRFSQMAEKPCAVYLTSPDYLGGMCDIAAIAEVCHRHGVLLLIDNAHGAYLKFLTPSLHPIDLGADMCCDSAHKTLPALTGTAYLHIAKQTCPILWENAKSAMALFASTSPSYLLLASLDLVNRYLSDGYSAHLAAFLEKLDSFKKKLSRHGYRLLADEPMKITIDAKAYGYEGKALAKILLSENIVSEFSDRDCLVLMPSPALSEEALDHLLDVLLSIPKRDPLSFIPPSMGVPTCVMSAREAIMAPSEYVCASESEGRILAAPTVACPPAVPIVVSGELISREAVECFRYYGISKILVVKSNDSLFRR